MEATEADAVCVKHQVDIDYMDAVERLCNKDIRYVRKLMSFGLADNEDLRRCVIECAVAMRKAATADAVYSTWGPL